MLENSGLMGLWRKCNCKNYHFRDPPSWNNAMEQGIWRIAILLGSYLHDHTSFFNKISGEKWAKKVGRSFPYWSLKPYSKNPLHLGRSATKIVAHASSKKKLYTKGETFWEVAERSSVTRYRSHSQFSISTCEADRVLLTVHVCSAVLAKHTKVSICSYNFFLQGTTTWQNQDFFVYHFNKYPVKLCGNVGLLLSIVKKGFIASLHIAHFVLLTFSLFFGSENFFPCRPQIESVHQYIY